MADYENLSLEELLKHTQNHEAWYWVGMAYWGRNDFVNAARWLEKTMNDAGNEWSGKARVNLALSYQAGLHTRANKDEALRLFEKDLSGPMSNLYAGILYFNGTETKHDPANGKRLIEKAIELMIEKTGNDEYFSQSECYDIGWMYYKENNAKAYEWFEKCIARCNINSSSDRNLIELARRNIGVLRRDGV